MAPIYRWLHQSATGLPAVVRWLMGYQFAQVGNQDHSFMLGVEAVDSILHGGNYQSFSFFSFLPLSPLYRQQQQW